MSNKAEITTAINNLLQALKTDSEDNEILQRAFLMSQISDGYHTFESLYEFRKLYNAALFNEWAKDGKYEVHKSVRHHNGNFCFNNGEWFVVSAMLPTGLISNHYHIDDWDLFKIPSHDKILHPFDGHTSLDVSKRLKDFLTTFK